MNRYDRSNAARLLALVLASCLGLAACNGSGSGTTGVSGSTSTSSPPSSGGGTGGSSGGSGSGLATSIYNLSWSAVSDPNVTGYRVYYSTTSLTSSGTPSHIDVPLNTTSMDFNPATHGMPAGATLYMAVASYGTGGLESPLSNQVSVVLQ